VLEINKNRIDDIIVFGKMTWLDEIHIKDNQIGNLLPLKDLPSLKVLDVEMNTIFDFSNVAELEKRGCVIKGKKIQRK
jgi:Leucine-rich repeat (LRR) protein